MDLAQTRRSHAHEQYVLSNTAIFFRATQSEFWLDFEQAIGQLEQYAANVPTVLKKASRYMQNFIRDKFGNDQDLLAEHADHMRTAAANIIFLKDGLVPALKMDKDNPKFRLLALETFGYLRAEVEATENLII